MPHSSGGGSHGGGSHGGSFGGHGGGSGGGPRVSSRPFRGAKRYMYYDRKGNERYVYSTSMPRAESKFTFILGLLVFIPFIYFGFFMSFKASESFFPPAKLKPSYVENQIHISDGADLIDNEIILEDTLNSFEDITGICPYIMTVYDSDWQGKYSTLERYAYSLYVNNFNDEQHLLIVYSEPENADELDFVDWSWEGMQGDDTDPILTESKFDVFREDLQKNLMKDSVPVGDAFNNAFTKSLGYMMDIRIDSNAVGIILFMLIWNLIIVSAIVASVKSFIVGNREYKEVGGMRQLLEDVEK